VVVGKAGFLKEHYLDTGPTAGVGSCESTVSVLGSMRWSAWTLVWNHWNIELFSLMGQGWII